MKFILGKKMGMSQVFEEDGTVTPVTVVSAEPMKVTQIRTLEKDGYEAVQVEAKSEKRKAKNKNCYILYTREEIYAKHSAQLGQKIQKHNYDFRPLRRRWWTG